MMHILQLCKKFPYPPKDGEAIAILNLTKALSSLGCDMTLLAMNTPKHYYPIEQLPKSIQQIARFKAVHVDTSVSYWGVLKNLLTSNPYHVSRFYSHKFEKALQEQLEHNNFDIIQLEGLYLTSYIPLLREFCNCPIVMRSHNIEHQIWQRIAQWETNPLKKWYLNKQAHRLHRYENEHINDYDALLPISPVDADHYQRINCPNPIHTLPAGIDLNEYNPAFSNPTQQPLSIFFLGGLDWIPNQQGLQWFIENVWPAVLSDLPQTQLQIAGRNMPKEFHQYETPQVQILGEVEDAKALMGENDIMIVPLFAGSGMRIKIIEAMAIGNTVITTPLGKEGIPAEHEKHLFVAKTAEEFLDTLQQCAQAPSLLRQIGKNARQFVEKHYDIHKLAPELMNFYQTLV